MTDTNTNPTPDKSTPIDDSANSDADTHECWCPDHALHDDWELGDVPLCQVREPNRLCPPCEHLPIAPEVVAAIEARGYTEGYTEGYADGKRKSPRGIREAHDEHIGTLRAVAREHGYALAVHGSLERDIDLIAAPWVESASDAETLAVALRNAVHGAFGQENEADARPHGRHTWAIHVPGFGGTYFDLSVMPTSAAIEARGASRERAAVVEDLRNVADRWQRHADGLRGVARDTITCSPGDFSDCRAAQLRGAAWKIEAGHHHTGPDPLPTLLAEAEARGYERGRDEAMSELADKWNDDVCVGPPGPAEAPVWRRAGETHELKTWPPYFEEVLRGRKKHELRLDDRGFAVGDMLYLREWDPHYSSYTHRAVTVTVTYISREATFGLQPGWVCMSIERTDFGDDK